MNDELRIKFAELDEDLQEVEGGLAGQVADLRRQIKERDERQLTILSWLVATTRLLFDCNTRLTHEERKSVEDGWDEIMSKKGDPK